MPISRADMRTTVLMGIATVAAGILMLNANATLFAIPVAAFALAWLTYRFGTAPAALLALFAGVVVALLGPSLLGTTALDGVFVAVSLLAVGPVTAMLLRRYPAVNVAAGISLVLTAAFLAAPAGSVAIAATVQLMREWAAASTSPAPATVAVTVKAMTGILPAVVFYQFGLGVAIAVSFVGRAGRMLGLEVNRYGALADMDVSFHTVWPTIIGLALAATGSLWSKAPVLVGQVGTNMLLFVRPLLFLQGAAVFAALYRKMGAGRIAKTVGMVLLTFTEMFIPSVSVVGLADLFTNLRKIPRGQEAVPGKTV
jgi:hypothetical protein